MKNKLTQLLIVIVLGLGLLATSSSASAWGHHRLYYYYSDSAVRDCNGCCVVVRCKVVGFFDRCGNWVTTRNVCWSRR